MKRLAKMTTVPGGVPAVKNLVFLILMADDPWRIGGK
jgi:hypothetical protein